jgi:hypothetical protein
MDRWWHWTVMRLTSTRLLELARALSLEREREYARIARARLKHWAAVAAQEEVLP